MAFGLRSGPFAGKTFMLQTVVFKDHKTRTIGRKIYLFVVFFFKEDVL